MRLGRADERAPTAGRPHPCLVSESVALRQVPVTALRGLVGLLPWALLLAYIVANSTPKGGSTNWGDVVRVSTLGLAAALVLVAGLAAWQPFFRAFWRGWTGVCVLWAVAFCAFFAVGLALGPFV